MATWVPIKEYQDLCFECVEDGIAEITINNSTEGAHPESMSIFEP
jgi:hypothetical protein